MGFLCAPEGPAKGERLRAQPRPPRLRRGGLRPDQRASRPPHGGLCSGQAPARTLHKPAEIMRMPAKKCEIVSKPAAICEKPDLLIV